MRLVLLTVLAVASLALPAAATTPATKLTVTTKLEGGASPRTYTLTCRPAGVRGLPARKLNATDACRALALVGSRLYLPRLSRHLLGCEYFAAPRRAVISGYRNGRKVRTFVEVGACERLLVPRRVLDRFLVWADE